MLNAAKGRRWREAALAKINNKEELEAWLRKQTREISVAFAARAALRVLPFVQEGRRPSFDDDLFSNIGLPVFRAVSVSWAVAKFPTHETELAARAASATGANAAAARAAHASVANAANAAAYAAAAASAAARANAVIARAAANSANAAAAIYGETDALLRAHRFSNHPSLAYGARLDAISHATTTAGYVAEAFWSAVSADATDVAWGKTAADIAGSPLWPEGQPDWLREVDPVFGTS